MNNTVKNCNITGFFGGATLVNSLALNTNNNTLSNNTVNATYYDIYLSYSGGNTLANNTLYSTHTSSKKTQGLIIDGSTISRFQNSIGESNTINGLPIYYIDGQVRPCVNNTVYTNGSSYGYMGFVGCSNITVTNSAPTDAVLLAFNTNSTISNLNMNFTFYAIYLEGSRLCNVTNNTVNGNINYAITLSNSNNNTVANNTLTSNTIDIQLSNAYNNTIIDNNASGSTYRSIWIFASGNNNFTGGSITSIPGASYAYLQGAAATNTFTNTNFTAQRMIGFAVTADWFVYQNATGSPWLKTNGLTGYIQRTLNNWSQTNMSWSENVTSGTATANYTLTGLLPGRYYNVYNASVQAYTLRADGSGTINFTIGLTTTTREIKAEVNASAPQINFTAPTDASGTTVNRTWSYVNVTVTDPFNTSSFIDWNRSLVGYWSFESTNSSGVFDNSTYGGFAPFSGGVNTSNLTAGVYGNGLVFNGSQYVNASLNGTALTSLTVELWAKPTGAQSQTGVFQWTNALSSSSPFLSLQRVNSTYVKWFADAGWRTEAPASDGVWQHYAATYNGTAWTFYTNGTVSGTYSGGRANNATATSFYLGNGYNGYFNGTIDEVQVWSRALSQEEILASYNSSALYHNFTDIAEGTYSYYAYAIDESGNANATETRTLTIDIPPRYSSNRTSTTVAGANATFSLAWTDYGLSGYVFSTNNTGVWANDTFTPFNTSLGYYTTGASFATINNWNSALAGKFIAPASGYITSISWYGRYAYADENLTALHLGVYSDNSGSPGSLLGNGSTSANTTPMWCNVTGLNIPVAGGSTYWLAVHATAGTLRYYYDAGSANQVAYKDSGVTQNLPATFPTPTGYNNSLMSIYANFTPTSAWSERHEDLEQHSRNERRLEGLRQRLCEQLEHLDERAQHLDGSAD